MTSIHRLSLFAALCTTAVAAAGAASAQAYQLNEGVTVYSHRAPSDADTLSRAVSYSDLDLTTRTGADELRYRVARAADALCDRLGEGNVDPVLPSCQASARDSAARQVNDAIDDARYARYASSRYSAYRAESEASTSAAADRGYDDEDR